MKKMLLAMAIMMAAVPGVKAQVTHGVNRADMDLSVKPGDDFYEYAGGGWMKANPLSKHPEYSSYGVFNVIAEENQNRLRDMFLELGKTDHKFGTVDQKVADLYKMAMDSDRLNSEGVKPLLADLAKVKNVITLDIEQLAKDNEIPRSANVILLGAAQKALGIEYEKLENAIRRVFGRKGDAVVDANLKALAIGKEAQR